MEGVIPSARYAELEKRYKESVVRAEALQSYISRLPLRSEMDKLEADILDYKSRIDAMTGALDEKRRREQSLCQEIEDLKRRLAEKPVDSEKNLSAFLATEKVSGILKKYEEEIVRSKACARKWEAKSKQLSEESLSLETKLKELEKVLAKTRSDLKSARKQLAHHEDLEAQALETSRGMQRRFTACITDVREVMSACSEALETRELTPVLLLGALIGQVGGVHEKVQQPIADFPAYLQYLRTACDVLVDTRDGLHTWVQRLVDACTKYLADVNGTKACLLQ